MKQCARERKKEKRATNPKLPDVATGSVSWDDACTHIDTALSRKSILESSVNLPDWCSAVYSVVFAKEVNHLYTGLRDSAAMAELPHLKAQVRTHEWQQPMSEAGRQGRKAAPTLLDLFGMLSVEAQTMVSAIVDFICMHASCLMTCATLAAVEL